MEGNDVEQALEAGAKDSPATDTPEQQPSRWVPFFLVLILVLVSGVGGFLFGKHQGLSESAFVHAMPTNEQMAEAYFSAAMRVLKEAEETLRRPLTEAEAVAYKALVEQEYVPMRVDAEDMDALMRAKLRLAFGARVERVKNER